MKLSKIIINGFKSFADKTELRFNQPITCIVGPNGCGKSNVVDAIKWVCGNQSPKSLRSGQMTDVIFSGSSSRKASNMAQVSLVFTDVRKPGVEQDTLEISRRLYRSGESEYLINNKTSRLKDIKELFMDTGVGVSAYSIIEQGQIDQLLQASKTDRRMIFEEAAGISKFKAHKKEAIRKLDRTEQNLLRLADIVTEVQKQLRSIKLQAGKARNYLEYSTRLKELRIQYSLAEYDKIITQRQGKQSKLGQWQEQFSEITASVSRCDAETGQLTAQITETETQINRWDSTLISARSRIEQHHERIGFLKSRIEELLDRKRNAASQIQHYTEQAQQIKKDLNSCDQELAENQQLLESRNAMLAESEEGILQINAQCGELQAELEDEKSGIIDIVRRTAQLHNEIKSLSNYRDNLSNQKERLSGKATQTQQQLSEWLTEKAQYQTKLEDIQSVLSQLQSSLEEKRHEMDHIGDEKGQLLDTLAGLKETRSALTSELNVLNDMESKRQGINTSLRTILNKAGGTDDTYSFIEGIVADVISAAPQYAQAVEAALQGQTDALVINSTGAYLKADELRKKLDGRLRVLCMDRMSEPSQSAPLSGTGIVGRLIDHVSFDAKYTPLVNALLGQVYLVEQIDKAIDLAASVERHTTFVTTAGEVFSQGHILDIGPISKNVGLISRKSRITQIQQELSENQSHIQNKETLIEAAEHKNEHLSGLCKDLRTSIYEANTEKVDAESRLRSMEQNIKRLSDEQPLLKSEIELLDQEITDSVQKEHDSKQKLEELEQVNNQRNEHIRMLQGRFEQEKQIQQSRMSELTDLKVQVGQFAEQQKGIRQKSTSLQSQLQHCRMSIESARTDQNSCGDQVLDTERNILATTSRVSELYLEKEQAQKHSQQLHATLEVMVTEKKKTDLQLRESRTQQQEVEDHIHQLQLQLSQLEVKDEDLTQRVCEELQMDLAEAYQNFQQQDVNWDEVRDEINTLRGKIDRLGNVNVDAIEQQEELEQRFEFLTNQVEDLNKSKTQLEQLIDKINKESVDIFRETFEQIRMNFQQIFRKLFGGGKADILLEDPDNILECGIEIIARPPGKETRSISLLSGGEKTMTAIALLFAVFRSKPSPFCVLDEVDAALDEANNERFNLIVQDFKEMSQFIIVSHSKRTMSIADILYGITMQTKGVSKKISVQFDDQNNQNDDNDAAVA